MKSILGDLDPGEFLSEYWQKKPCLIRQALPDYEPPLDGDDLAGLACEELAESRLVSGCYAEQDWQVRYGPFDEADFSTLPESNWTLLVQDVEKHYPPLQDLMELFDFLPSWRLDDLMISYAVTGGSVGPHVDQYDVFLLQTQGERRWQIARAFKPDLLAGCPINVLLEFEAEQEWVVRPGDMLYLPPNVAHYGVALEPGMTWSVGLRAPSAADLLMALGEEIAELADGGPRYTDAGLQLPERPGLIDTQALSRMRGLISGLVDDHASFDQFAGRFISRFRLAHEPVSPGPELDTGSLVQAMQSGSYLVRNPWTRLAWVAKGGGAVLFAAGEAVECSRRLAESVCAKGQPDLFTASLAEVDLAAIVQLVNGGHLVLSRD